MGYQSTTILSVATDTTGTSYPIERWKERMRCRVTITGTCTCAIQGSEDGTNWEALSSVTSSDVVNVTNYGINYLRAVTTGMNAATCVVEWSWNGGR